MGQIKILLLIGAIALGLCTFFELALRWFFGFGKPLIYQADPEIGYLLAPSQTTRRFGNRITINRYSMRSADMSEEPAPDTQRILLLGDSIANGGWWTDQEQILSNLISHKLKEETGKAVEVLNISANSWCPRNEIAYLRKYGTFGAEVIILLINTDDLFGTAPTSIPVGRDRFYPSHYPPLGIVEAFTRLVLPYESPPEMAAVRAEKGDRVGFNLQAIQDIHTYAQKHHAQVLLAMTPLKRELGEPGPRDYEWKARKRLLALTEERKIPYIDFLPIFNAQENPETLYRDHIHLSPLGYQVVNEILCSQTETRKPPGLEGSGEC
ncbi:SGNH/GDSL hydrolase family protein [Roseofilum capinflatum]|uniref:SGNH/GDSL hydrolase family protein n=1 Tax=Roseofilum capinflatum BLCC-M114 TaxID=3022440 RepID=A0ABT7BBA4_9CYAN|nr:SGNH/GDSL hydrolase family protein [Roseofilum capinflatum]MDJ1176460.1 SGNH/GDSL hydrolase family protein [Roseofilum capinflatum BLCC-M114]